MAITPSVDAQSGNTAPGVSSGPTTSTTSAPPPTGTGTVGSYGFGETAAPDDKLEYTPGGDNQEFYQDEFGSLITWQQYLEERLFDEVPKAAAAFGENPDTYTAWLQQLFPSMLWEIDQSLNDGSFAPPPDYLSSPQGFEFVYKMAVNYLGARDKRLLSRPGQLAGGTSGGGGGGGGGGSRMPTADEIRANFDLDQLSSAVNDIYRGLILDDAKDPRGIASAYVEAIVRNPQQKLDFQSFVEKQAMATPRFASIYRNKPAALSPQQYIQPFLQAALQTVRPNDAAKIATGGAQMGADPNAYRARLARTNAQTTSAPFIAGLEQRLHSLKGVLKG